MMLVKNEKMAGLFVSSMGMGHDGLCQNASTIQVSTTLRSQTLQELIDHFENFNAYYFGAP